MLVVFILSGAVLFSNLHTCRHLQGSLELLRISSSYELFHYGMLDNTLVGVWFAKTLVKFRKWMWITAAGPSMINKDVRGNVRR